MLIRIGYELTFSAVSPTPMILLLYVHPERAGDLQNPECIRTDPVVDVESYVDGFGNRGARVVAPAGVFRVSSANIIRDTGLPDARDLGAWQHTVESLPIETLQFLVGSRYCEVDRFGDIAWQMFGNVPPGWPRVQAVCDWVHQNVKFGYEFARPTKTTWDVYNERAGVCRDFTHLAITLCRCLNIPARYATGYLGDIGVPADPSPMDFAAFMEVYLANRWWPVDARHNAARQGRVLMARGRDAVDVALTTSFGLATLTNFQVVTDEVK